MTPTGKRKGRRMRRRRLRGRMLPASVTEISTRTRWRCWPKTRQVTRYHRLLREVRGT